MITSSSREEKLKISWRKRLFHDIWQEWMLKIFFFELEGKLMF